LGIVIATGLVAYLRFRAGEELVVQLVDRSRGRVVTGVRINVIEHNEFPILRRWKFLPTSLYTRDEYRTMEVIDGSFRVRRADLYFITVARSDYNLTSFGIPPFAEYWKYYGSSSAPCPLVLLRKDTRERLDNAVVIVTYDLLEGASVDRQ
jgi:hypothetical protein